MTPAPFSAAYFEAQLVAQQQAVDAALAQVTATDVYQRYQQELGKLELLRQQTALAQKGAQE